MRPQSATTENITASQLPNLSPSRPSLDNGYWLAGAHTWLGRQPAGQLVWAFLCRLLTLSLALTLTLMGAGPRYDAWLTNRAWSLSSGHQSHHHPSMNVAMSRHVLPCLALPRLASLYFTLLYLSGSGRKQTFTSAIATLSDPVSNIGLFRRLLRTLLASCIIASPRGTAWG